MILEVRPCQAARQVLLSSPPPPPPLPSTLPLSSSPTTPSPPPPLPSPLLLFTLPPLIFHLSAFLSPSSFQLALALPLLLPLLTPLLPPFLVLLSTCSAYRLSRRLQKDVPSPASGDDEAEASSEKEGG